ncbi:interactor of constitutive active ROPs 3 [Benincasa hispida]|uniref:interactor of constitutive active ROPs 3 n=1 Tax=Benincasa hispida TaxID=102211 RepID=UPI0018FFEE75|nr:interactor of constitutive active ROPs 3 [Benincasa hispida]XP_038894664.1 interactor of constitutive active ROPs 3 [Benincasa hispida]XP_038894665.1 interactor of constitutive active ROPs 3 [Benincasa hispida]XP_038894666.1 interactor of constitutive active ROPs 3 [Benincasa hispida]XP_038894667.1 interactor of constitutive active ROPs 3 [Benincasa hispida]XP_038894668.1 interactor of constitutive active ROPs 3 [Benincasa hispida]XP_038894669.1 interactor of constitutive active ROPs 3 [Be
MQTPKSRNSCSEAPQKVSPRVARKLRPTALECDSASSSNQVNNRSIKERSPKVIDRKSPRSPASSELQKKRPSKISELESQVSQLQEDLTIVKDQLCLSESCKKEFKQDAEEAKNQLVAMTLKLQQSEKLVLELSASEEARVIELQQISQDRDQAWQSELEAIQEQHKLDYAALASAVNEIQQLKIQLEMVAKSETKKTEHADSANNELDSLRSNLAETLCLVKRMECDLKNCRESEAQAQLLVSETLAQLEDAKKRVEELRHDGMEAMKAYHSIASELDESKARVNLLEELVGKLKTDAANASSNLLQHPAVENEEKRGEDHIEELCSLKSEIEQLKTALEMAETKYHEEQIQSAVQIKMAYEQVDQLKSNMNSREFNLEQELKKSKVDIEELKADLMDKETELQGISEENEQLQAKIQKNLSSQREYELEREIKELKEHLAELKSNLTDKERDYHSISDENEMLKLEINKRIMIRAKASDGTTEVEDATAAEQDAHIRLGIVMEEADKSNKRAARVSEQLEAAQAANAEIEMELRRLRVQSDQWRKAAEAAAAMLSAGNNGKFMDRSGSLDSSYDSAAGKFNGSYCEEIDDDLLKKKNGNVLKKIGVLWKKQQK